MSNEKSLLDGSKTKAAGLEGWLDQRFEVTKRGSTIRTELRAGLVNFFANCYIAVLIPQMLSSTGDSLGKSRYLFGLCMTSFVSSFLVGWLSNLPIPAGCGIGCATYFAYSLNLKYPNSQTFAPTTCLLSGILMVLLAIPIPFSCFPNGISWELFASVPDSVKSATPIGLGLMLSLCGFQQMRLVQPAPLTGLAIGDLGVASVWLAIVGLVLSGLFYHKGLRSFSLLLPMFLITMIGWIFSIDGAAWPNFGHWLTMWSKFGSTYIDFDLSHPWPSAISTSHATTAAGAAAHAAHAHAGNSTHGAGRKSPFGPIDGWQPAPVLPATWVAALLPMVSIYIICLFDVASITYAVSKVADAGTGIIFDDVTGNLRGASMVLVACGLGTLLSASLGCSPVIVLGESFAGVLVGGRTGLTAIVMGCLFLLAVPLAPIITAIPLYASSPVLVLLGVEMLSLIHDLELRDKMKALPSFCTIALMPYLYSIDKAIVAGLFMHVALHSADLASAHIARACDSFFGRSRAKSLAMVDAEHDNEPLAFVDCESYREEVADKGLQSRYMFQEDGEHGFGFYLLDTAFSFPSSANSDGGLAGSIVNPALTSPAGSYGSVQGSGSITGATGVTSARARARSSSDGSRYGLKRRNTLGVDGSLTSQQARRAVRRSHSFLRLVALPGGKQSDALSTLTESMVRNALHDQKESVL